MTSIAEQNTKESHLSVVYSCISRVYTSKDRKRGTFVVIITNRSLRIYPKNSDKIKNEFSFLQLTGFAPKSAGEIELKFENDIVRITHQDEHFVENLEQVLCQFMTVDELEKFGLKKPQFQSNFMILSRMYEYKKIAGIDVENEELFEWIKFGKPDLVLTKTISNESIMMLLDALPLCPFVRTIEFDGVYMTKSMVDKLAIINC